VIWHALAEHQAADIARLIVCADPIYKPLEASRNWVKGAGWKTIEIKCGHDAMVIAPDRLADMLDTDAA
jgi:hypothetical protein